MREREREIEGRDREIETKKQKDKAITSYIERYYVWLNSLLFLTKFALKVPKNVFAGGT